MALKEVTKQINGKTVFCRQWPASKAMVNKAKLIQIGGTTVMPFVDGIADIVAMMELEQLAKPDELVSLIREFVCEVRVDGKEILPAQFDSAYKGNLWEVVELFAFACEVQYKDFFELGFNAHSQLYQSAANKKNQE